MKQQVVSAKNTDQVRQKAVPGMLPTLLPKSALSRVLPPGDVPVSLLGNLQRHALAVPLPAASKVSTLPPILPHTRKHDIGKSPQLLRLPLELPSLLQLYQQIPQDSKEACRS